MIESRGSSLGVSQSARSFHALLVPDSGVRLLLHAALDAGPAAATAWRQWRRSAGSAAVDPSVRRLLPLVWWNLGGPQSEVEGLEEACRCYEVSWASFQERSLWLAEVLAALRELGVRAVLLKGFPLALQHYQRPALRPMADVDLLVVPDDRETTATVLGRLGYEPLRHPPRSALQVMHSIGYARRDGASLDLHWFALLECCYPGADEDLWSHAGPCAVGGEATLAPDPTSALFVVCAHGVRWSPVRHAIWIADVVTLLRTCESELCWDRLIGLARDLRMARRLHVALAYVVAEFGVAVPAGVLAQLEASGKWVSERLELRLRQRPPSLLGGALLHWFVHRRRARAGVDRGALAFARYLQATWGLPSAWRLPASAITRLWSRSGVSQRRGSES